MRKLVGTKRVNLLKRENLSFIIKGMGNLSMLAYNGRCKHFDAMATQLNKMRMTPAWSYPCMGCTDSPAQLFLKCALHEDALQQ